MCLERYFAFVLVNRVKCRYDARSRVISPPDPSAVDGIPMSEPGNGLNLKKAVYDQLLFTTNCSSNGTK